MRVRHTMLVACALCASLLLYALDSAARPKVCLVLSGGGARGAAHIGVLEVLEQMHVPIDCITGTSMGALVGGAYASGMTTADMQKLVAGMSTQLLFQEKPPRQDQTIRRKLDDRSILFGLEVGLSDEVDLMLQKGVVTGVQLETVLRRIAKVQGYRTFDELPIPYRAVATDLVTGKAVVFADGELPNVMRASMSVPGVIAPAEIDRRLLVDGGLTNNLPVDVARAMGAEVIIAVNLGTPLLKRDEIHSLIGVTTQMINILTEQNVQASLASLRPTDILIEPELGDFSAGDFDSLPKAMPIGAAAARKAADKLAALAVPADVFAVWAARREAAQPPEEGPVAEIRFEPMQRVNAAMLAELLETKPNTPLDQDKLDRDMRRLFGTGDFEHVSYRIIEEAGRRVLDIDAVEKSWGPNYLRFGLALGSDLQGDNFFNVAASYRRTWVNRLGAEWRTDAQLGRTSRIATEFYQPLETRNYFFVAPRAEAERRSVDVFQASQRIARFDFRTVNAGIDVGTEVTKYGEGRIGVLYGKLSAGLETGPPELQPSGSVNQGGVLARAAFDQLDSADFPRSGFAGSANLYASTKALGADDSYNKWDIDATGAYSFGRHTLMAGVKAGGKIGGQPLPVYDVFQWGGFLQQSGYATGELLGERLTFGRVVYLYRIAEQKLFEGIYAGISLEAGRMDKPLLSGGPTGLLKSTAAFFGIDSPIGPMYLAIGFAADGSRSGYFFLGRP